MRRHRYLTGLATAAVAAFALAAPDAQAQPLTQFDFSGQPEENLVFESGGSFTIGDFEIDDQKGGEDALVGLTGMISGSFSFADPGMDPTAPVTSPGDAQLTITGADGTVTGALNLTLIGEGAEGFEDTAAIRGTVDFSGSPYAGANPDLLALTDEGPITVTFQTPGVPINLAALYETGGTFSYSGSVATPFTEGEVPEPATLGLIGAGLLGLGMIGRRRKATA